MACCGMSSSWTFIPREILLNIFEYYIATEGQKNLLKILTKVCPEWENVCFDRYLWRTLDGTLTSLDLFKLSNQGSLAITETLTLYSLRYKSGPKVSKTRTLELGKEDEEEKIKKSIKNKGQIANLNLVFRDLAKLKVINCSGFATVEQLIENSLKYCPQISKIIFSRYDKNAGFSPRFIKEEFSEFLNLRGSNLSIINISHCTISKSTLLFKKISDCCPNLLEFHFFQIDGNNNFPIEYFQIGCPKLEVLYLDSCTCLGSNKGKAIDGFPNLEVFTYTSNGSFGTNDFELSRVLHNSKRLKFLDVRGNPFISCQLLDSLPAEDIESIYISYSRACHSIGICNLIKRWCHSLKTVDIAWCSGNFIDEAVLSLSSYLESKLENINLSGTKVSSFSIKKLIQGCNNLQVLNLESCRSLKRGLKRVYHSKYEIENLFKQLCDEMT